MIKCPKCGGKVQTLDSANSEDNKVYRVKSCLNCMHMFCTSESVLEDFDEAKVTFLRKKKGTAK